MPRLEDYSFGRLVIDGDEHRHDVIVLPGRVVGDWWRRDGHSLQIEDLEPVLDELPPTLIVGCGAHGRLTPDPGALRTLTERGIQVEVLLTGDAVRRYGELDEALTAAAIHLTC